MHGPPEGDGPHTGVADGELRGRHPQAPPKIEQGMCPLHVARSAHRHVGISLKRKTELSGPVILPPESARRYARHMTDAPAKPEPTPAPREFPVQVTVGRTRVTVTLLPAPGATATVKETTVTTEPPRQTERPD